MSSFSSIPKEPHWAVITSTMTYIPGDERSRTNPGHGYPESYEENISYEAFVDVNQLEKRLISYQDRKMPFKVLWVEPKDVLFEVNVSLK